MALTTKDDMLDPQILLDALRGELRSKKAFMGSILVSQGAVLVSPGMPKGGPGAIGKKIDIPYFGRIGKFVNNPDGSAITPTKLGQVLEQATISRASLASETTAWAQGLADVDPNLGDPHQEAARQIVEEGEEFMDAAMVSEFKTTPLVKSVYSATEPVYGTWDLTVQGKTLWGDQQDGIVAMVVHSQSAADMATEKNGKGEPMLMLKEGPGGVMTYNNVPLLVSDNVPLDGSSMTSPMGETGTSPPDVTLAGTPLGPWKLVIDCVTGGLSNGTATFRFSTDGGSTWSATYAIPNGGGPILLDDSSTAAVADINGEKTDDSLVGKEGRTGITATFTNGTYNADNVYKSIANLCVSDMILQRGAGGFWYNAQRLGLKSDDDILADADIIAAHLYHAAKLYRRRRGPGSRPGCVLIKKNVRGYTGGTAF
jgi:hypothetical protein